MDILDWSAAFLRTIPVVVGIWAAKSFCEDPERPRFGANSFANELSESIPGDHCRAKTILISCRTNSDSNGVDAGGLDESCKQQPGTPAYASDRDAEGVRRARRGKPRAQTRIACDGEKPGHVRGRPGATRLSQESRVGAEFCAHPTEGSIGFLELQAILEFLKRLLRLTVIDEVRNHRVQLYSEFGIGFHVFGIRRSKQCALVLV
jgi:hypothetical protein